MWPSGGFTLEQWLGLGHSALETRLVELLNYVRSEWNMAGILGAPPLVPLALVPKGQNVGGGGGAAAASSRCALRAQEPPPNGPEGGGEGGPGCRRLWAEGATEEGPRCADRAEASADVDAAVGRCISQAVRSSSKSRLRRATEGLGKVLGSSFCRESISYWPA